MQNRLALALVCGAILSGAGCATRQIVKASPSSVSSPPPEETQTMPQPEPPALAPPEEQPAPEVASPELPPAPAKRPVAPRPRPTPTETVEPTPTKPTAPQISPQLSPKDLETARSNTNANIATAENNLKQANGRQLSAAQKDLTDKISSFLAQSREAIQANDWARAQNLAEKARVLSTELVKSF